MKNVLIIASASLLILSACKSTQVVSYTDDVYVNPAEEQARARAAAAEKQKQEALETQNRQEQARADQQKEEDNPYYREPAYNSDDYYDYEYAARINRFHNPVYGAGFYDPFYTNMYTYNQNPMFWGTSIYSSYGMGMPSAQFGMYSMGISTGWGYNRWNNCGWGYYDPFCFNSGFNMGYGYSPWGYSPWGYNNWSYMSGYNQGYMHGLYNSQWYYNRMDANSGYGKVSYGPRNTSTGGNTDPRRSQGARIEESSGRRSYIETVAQEQEKQPRFTAPTGNRRIDNSGRTSERSGQRGTNPAVNPNPSRSNPTPTDRRRDSRRVEPQQQPRQQQPSQQQQRKPEPQQQPRQNSNRSSGSWNPAPANPGGGGGNTGGGSSPRNSGGGGNRSPR